MSLSIDDECNICEVSLLSDEETIITDCGHKFHFLCALKRVNDKHKNDCRTCKTKMALSNAVTKYQTKKTGAYPYPDVSASQNQCRYGGQCRSIDDDNHTQQYEHPSYCPSGGDCENMKPNHLKAYRHLPLCKYNQKCLDYQKRIQAHCQAFRHCKRDCPYGNNCASLHEKQHRNQFDHPYPTPCPLTPYHCKLYSELTNSIDRRKLSKDIQQHCLDYAHVCPLGRKCKDPNSLHWEKSIHIARYFCPDGDKCNKLTNEDHLNSFTHVQIPDIRELCKYADECPDRQKLEHIAKFLHNAKYEHSGILRYFNLNKNIDFVQNQKDIVDRVNAYVQKEKWKPLPSGNIPQDILTWIRTVQPVHRCNPIVFESILLHGHVMSREYMQNLKDRNFVANSVLQHGRIRRINGIQEKIVAEHAKEFITALVTDHFDKKGFFNAMADADTADEPSIPIPTKHELASCRKIIQTKEAYFSKVLDQKDFDAICGKAIEIADASINLHTNPAGIGFDKDKDLGTDKTVFGILGPHLGHYYGDIIIVFNRSILHHPDSTFSLQAATTFTTVTNMSAYNMRPWLGAAPGSLSEKIKVYHRSKLSASIPGYDYTAALELIALTSNNFQLKSMDIDLKKVLDRWISVDSHTNIEAHLPQLIPLSYIDHIYIPKNLYNSLSDSSQQAMTANFKDRISIVPHDGDPNQPHLPRSPIPTSKSRAEYQNYVVKELIGQYTQYMKYPPARPVRGACITLASTDFSDHHVLPLTISQAYDQYCFAYKRRPPDQITYIYWQVMGGDMMMTLSNEPVESGQKQPNLRCLTCYIAPKPILSPTSYHEHYSYIDNKPPFKHHILRETGEFSDKSNRFHIGCNTDDFMTFCLEIHRATNTARLTHAGPDSIYNHEIIAHTFRRSELDLTKLNYVHVSAGSRTVPIRNLTICFEVQHDLHPTFDKNFK